MALTLSMTSAAPAWSERELVQAARHGDDRAFERLYGRYQARILSFVLSRVRDHGRAEDIAQEVFISALRRLRASDQAITFKPWIYEIAKNACIDEFRRSQRGREVSLDADEELVGGRRGLLSIAPTPPAAAENKQRLDDLQSAFGGLSENQHQLLVLREFEGLSYKEIGSRTGMSRQVVESTLFRARRKLSEEYTELASGRRCEHVQGVIEDGRAKSSGSFGLRERRQISRHLAHCQPCRRVARLGGVDEELFRRHGIAAKIAALLPIPLFRWPLRGGHAASKGTSANAAARAGSHHLVAAQSLQSAASAAGPTGASITLGKAAAVAAALVIGGAGGGVLASSSPAPAHRAPVPTAPSRHAVGAKASQAVAPARVSIPAAVSSRLSDRPLGQAAIVRGVRRRTQATASPSSTRPAPRSTRSGGTRSGRSTPANPTMSSPSPGSPSGPPVSGLGAQHVPPLPLVSPPRVPPLPSVSPPRVPPLPPVSPPRTPPLPPVSPPRTPPLPPVSPPPVPPLPPVALPPVPPLPPVALPPVPPLPPVALPPVPPLTTASEPDLLGVDLVSSILPK